MEKNKNKKDKSRRQKSVKLFPRKGTRKCALLKVGLCEKLIPAEEWAKIKNIQGLVNGF